MEDETGEGPEFAETLVIAYWDNATPPFAFTKNGNLTGGIIYEIGKVLASRLQVNVVYQLVPTKRIERELASGRIDLDCITSPIWKKTPESYSWSPPLFDGADRFLIRKDANISIDSYDDLEGLRVGTYAGYVYHQDIMTMLDGGRAQRVTVQDIDHGIRLLLAKRIDVLIDFEILLRYKIKQGGLKDKVMFADKTADEFDLMCAYSPKTTVGKEALDKHLQSMVDDNTIADILAKYRYPPNSVQRVISAPGSPGLLSKQYGVGRPRWVVELNGRIPYAHLIPVSSMMTLT